MAENDALEQKRVFAEVAAVVEAQTLLHSVMLRKGVSRADLARAMNVSRARVTQIFSDECSNLTIRLLARALCALGEDLVLLTQYDVDRVRDENRLSNAAHALSQRETVNWVEIEDYAHCFDLSTANDNMFGSLPEVRTVRNAYEELAA
jgi:transcriptional regulator with XRE-family HTH domain